MEAIMKHKAYFAIGFESSFLMSKKPTLWLPVLRGRIFTPIQIQHGFSAAEVL